VRCYPYQGVLLAPPSWQITHGLYHYVRLARASGYKSSRYFNHLMTGESCAGTGQSTTFQGMFHYQSTTLEPVSFHYRFSRGDRVQIISGKHKGETGIVDANVFQRSVDFPNAHLPCHHVLLDNRLVITINVDQVEALNEIVPVCQRQNR